MQPFALRTHSDGDTSGNLHPFYRLLWLFLLALSIRWIYALTLYATMGDGGLLGADSRGFMDEARQLVSLIQAGKLQPAQWLGMNTAVMPLFSWLLAANIAVFGEHGALSYVMVQGAIDAATCLLVYFIAATFGDRIAMPAGIAAAINPTQVILAGIVYTDTPFLFFIALMLLGALRWLKAPTLHAAFVIGIGLGGAALSRMMVAPWVPFLCLFLLAVQAWRRDLRLRQIGHAAVIGVVFCLCVAPVLLRNVYYYNAWALTSQGGYHLAYWVVPLVKEAKDGTPWETTAKALQKKEREQRTGPVDNFKSSVVAREIGLKALKELGYASIIKAWLTGAAINIASPAVILSPPVSQLPRTGFFGTVGSSPIEKIFNYIFRSDNRLYAIILIIGIAGVGLIRLLQLVGLTALIDARNAPGILLLLSWIFYVLAVNGPVASPKYRLPMEPALNLLTGAGFLALYERRRRPSVLKS